MALFSSAGGPAASNFRDSGQGREIRGRAVSSRRSAARAVMIEGLPLMYRGVQLMMRFVAALAFGLLVAGTVTAADQPKEILIRWHGQSFFEIRSSKGTRIVTDPHSLEPYGRISVE